MIEELLPRGRMIPGVLSRDDDGCLQTFDSVRDRQNQQQSIPISYFCLSKTWNVQILQLVVPNSQFIFSMFL